MDGKPNFTALIERQRIFFASGATLPLEFRQDSLRRLRQSLSAAEDQLAVAMHADLRKPPQEVYVSEIGMVIGEIDHAFRHLRRWMKPVRQSLPWIVWPARARIVPRPLGVALIIGPWNYPVQLLLLPLIGAIAAGNCAIVKPSELASQSSHAITAMLESTFAPEHVACVQGDRAVAETLLLERFDKIFFTGGIAAGRAVVMAAARYLTPVTLELGGKCPVIVCPDTNLKIAARRIVWAKTINAGQSCVAPDYLLVHRSVQSRLAAEMIASTRAMFGQDLQKSPDYGRIVNRRHFDRLIGYLQEGSIIAGGQNDPSDLFLALTLIENMRPRAKLLEEEIFGPVLPVLPFDDLSEAICFVKHRPAPLAVYLFTKERSVQHRVEQEIRCGGICVNDLVLHLFAKKLPFGGVGDSGMGHYHGRASFDCFTHDQPILNCGTALDPPFRYPPPKMSIRRFRQMLPWLLRE